MAFIVQDYKHLGARSITESIRSLGQSEGQEDDDEELVHARRRLDERSRKAVRASDHYTVCNTHTRRFIN